MIQDFNNFWVLKLNSIVVLKVLELLNLLICLLEFNRFVKVGKILINHDVL